MGAKIGLVTINLRHVTEYGQVMSKFFSPVELSVILPSQVVSDRGQFSTT